MTKPELIESVATATGEAKPDIDRTLEAILDRVSNALAMGDRVESRGFGIFEAKETKARTGRNPSTGEKIDIPCQPPNHVPAQQGTQERTARSARKI